MKKLKWLLMACFMVLLLGGENVHAKPVSINSGDGFFYYENEDGTLTISNYYGNEETVVFPSEIDGKKVTAICFKYFDSKWDRDTVKHIIISEGITDIVSLSSDEDSGTFQACNNLESVSLPSTLKSIGFGSFACCGKLSDLILPEHLTSIGGEAFIYCTSIKKINIPDSVINIEKNAFELGRFGSIPICANPNSYAKTYADENHLKFSCINHQSIITEPEIPATCTKEGFTENSYCSDCSTVITQGEAIPANGHTIVEEPEIPATCQHPGGVKGHCSICGAKATDWIHFIPIQKHKIVRIYTPPTCTEAGYLNIYCEYCKETYIDEDGLHMSIPEKNLAPGHQFNDGVIDFKLRRKTFTCTVCGFQYSRSLKKSDFPQKGEIISTPEESYTITKAEITAGTVAFIGTQSTKSNLIIPDTVTINDITYKVTSIADNALKGNRKVTNVTIGKNVTSIGKRAFSGCNRLKNITIGTNVKTIGAEAFKNCSNLRTITIQSKKLSSVGKNAFKGIHAKAKIKVPSKKLKKYQSTLKGKGQKSTVRITK